MSHVLTATVEKRLSYVLKNQERLLRCAHSDAEAQAGGGDGRRGPHTDPHAPWRQRRRSAEVNLARTDAAHAGSWVEQRGRWRSLVSRLA